MRRAVLESPQSGDLHTEIDSEYDRGLGTRLVAAALEDARGRRLSVVPVWPFVKAFLRSHPE